LIIISSDKESNSKDSSKEKEVVPPAKKKKIVVKIMNWNFFGGDSSDKDCSHNVQILNHFVGEKLMQHKSLAFYP